LNKASLFVGEQAMISVGSYEAKTHFSQLLNRVARGEKIVITKHGRAVAMLVPAHPENKKDIKQVIAELIAYRKRKRRTLGGLTIREMIDEGRRF
jgi:prevent-host-death family protein